MTTGISQTIWCQAQHMELGKEEEEGIFEVMEFVFPSSALCAIKLCFPGNGQAPASQCKVVNKFLVLVCLYMAFAFLIKLLLSHKPMTFLGFTFQTLRHPTMMGQLCGAEQLLRLNHNSVPKKLPSHMYAAW